MDFSETLLGPQFVLTILLWVVLTGLIGYLLLDVYRNYGLASQIAWRRSIERLFTEKRGIIWSQLAVYILLWVAYPSANSAIAISPEPDSYSEDTCSLYMIGRFEGELFFTLEHKELTSCILPQEEIKNKMQAFKREHSGGESFKTLSPLRYN